MVQPLSFVRAQDTRWYQYNRIAVDITVNKDTTFRVAETQTYLFHGTYNQGYREIPYRKIDTITDISVTDATTGKPLEYSTKRLEKTNPGSWGKYTTYRDGGSQNIEWYYDATDTTRKWTLYYTIHGGLEFLSERDRLYWNLFTNYQVPVAFVEATVTLPDGVVVNEDHIATYRSNPREEVTKTITPGGSVVMASSDFLPHEAFTIDISWPKGFVDRSAYWWGFWRRTYGIFGAIIIFIGSIVLGFIHWMRHEKTPQNKLAVVPHYKPPKNLRPAIAEIVAKETLTPKGMAATVVDLAVRGYLKIEETPVSWITPQTAIGCGIGTIVVAVLALAFASEIGVEPNALLAIKSGGTFLTLGLVFLRVFRVLGFNPSLSKNYLVRQVKPMDNQTDSYEREYIELLMNGKDFFTTDELRHSTDKTLYQKIEKIKETIYEHAHVTTRAYDVSPLQEKYKWIIWVILFVIVIFTFSIPSEFWQQPILLVAALVVCGIGLRAYMQYETRLNAHGIVLHNQWRGFKLFLETAEKGEHARATPDMFPKYLPYAMIFGVEHKWARAFDGMNMPVQAWFVGSHSSGQSFGSGTGGFSGFSASFSSSFASAFASSAGGGGGGGGSAGGGGGGGGGGAS